MNLTSRLSAFLPAIVLVSVVGLAGCAGAAVGGLVGHEVTK